MAKTILYRIGGETVEGRISGYAVGRNTPSIWRDGDGVSSRKRKAFRPVFRYPIAAVSNDSLESYSTASVMLSFTQYELHERVPIVFAEGKPEDAYLFGFQIIIMHFLLLLLGLLMLYIAFGGKL